jgi:prepilin-type processing-associated H-X9-DG protein
MGENEDIARWTSIAPSQDTPGWAARGLFGSAHSTGFNISFCDGSVQFVPYTVNVTVFRYLGNRRDGMPIKPSF